MGGSWLPPRPTALPGPGPTQDSDGSPSSSDTQCPWVSLRVQAAFLRESFPWDTFQDRELLLNKCRGNGN